MCRMCEGFSLEDVLALDAARIAEYGFAIIGVSSAEGDDDQHAPWAYTVGLLDAADHPEMVIAGPSIETSASLLSDLARSVLAGDRYDVGDRIEIGPGVARIGAVNEVHRCSTIVPRASACAHGSRIVPSVEAARRGVASRPDHAEPQPHLPRVGE